MLSRPQGKAHALPAPYTYPTADPAELDQKLCGNRQRPPTTWTDILLAVVASIGLVLGAAAAELKPGDVVVPPTVETQDAERRVSSCICPLRSR